MRQVLGIAVVLLPMICWGQPDTLWTRLYDNSEWDFAYAVQQTADGGFIIAGNRGSDYHVYLVKTDSLGTQQWSRVLGPLSSYAYDVQIAGDGGYILGGVDEAHNRGLLIKTNAVGQTQWTRELDENWTVCINRVVECPGGGCVAVGLAGPSTVEFYAYVARLDAQGAILWQHECSECTNSTDPDVSSRFDAICPASNGGYILAGVVDSMLAPADRDFLYAKVDSAGSFVWTRALELPGAYQWVSNLQPVSDGYLLMGFDEWYLEILRIDEDGNLVSRRAIPRSDTLDVHCSRMYLLPSGNLLTAGTCNFPFDDPTLPDMSLACISPADSLLWMKRYGGPANEYGEDMKLTRDGGCIIVGRTASFGANVWDFYAVRTGPVEEPSAATEAPTPPSSFSLSNFPNPFNSSTEISYEISRAGKLRLSVFDLLGREVAVLEDGRMAAGSHRDRFDGKDLASGVYIYRLQTAEGARAGKMVLLK